VTVSGVVPENEILIGSECDLIGGLRQKPTDRGSVSCKLEPGASPENGQAARMRDPRGLINPWGYVRALPQPA